MLTRVFLVVAILALVGAPPALAQGVTITETLDVPLEQEPYPAPPGGGDPPPLEPPPADSVVFVVDHSCSMGWGGSPIEVPGNPGATPWQAAQYELGRAVNGLDGNTRFSVVLFNHTFINWRPELVVADENNKAAAAGWVNGQYATGGTTYTPPVISGLGMGGGPPEVIMFLSDGMPNEGYSAVGSITSANGGQSIINTVAFNIGGGAVQIMQDIAASNGGECRIFN